MKMVAAALLCLLLAGCATPLPTATQIGSAGPTNLTAPSATASSTPSTSVAFRCTPITLLGPSPAADYCSPAAENAVLRAVASVGYPVAAVTIGPFNFDCGGPFAIGARSCPAVTLLVPAAYVSFAGTDKVAAVEIGTQRGGSITAATRILAEVPPVGCAMP